jgi:hypothetical protein
MGRYAYEITGREGAWTVGQDGNAVAAGAMDYATKEAAFEAAVMAATNALREGHEIVIRVPAATAGQSTLGNEP